MAAHAHVLLRGRLDRQVSPSRTQQMAWAAMPVFFFGVGLVDSGDTATHAYFLLQLSPEETRGQIEWHGSPSLFPSSGSA